MSISLSLPSESEIKNYKSLIAIIKRSMEDMVAERKVRKDSLK